MIKIYQLDHSTIQQLRALLLPLDVCLEADVSNYAKGRERYWLQHQWDLKERRFLPGHQAPELWTLCQAICEPLGFQPEIGLIAKGEQGIQLHRDDSYATFKAVSIQLGAANWIYDGQYPEYSWVPEHLKNASNPITYKVEDCVVVFNCKNPHAAEPLNPDRYSINLWHVSGKLRADFKDYCKQQSA